MVNEKWKIKCSTLRGSQIPTWRTSGTLPIHRGGPACRSSDKRFESTKIESPNNRRGAPCDRQTTVRSTPYRVPPKTPDNLQRTCSSIPTRCRSSDDTRKRYPPQAKRQPRCNPSPASPDSRDRPLGFRRPMDICVCDLRSIDHHSTAHNLPPSPTRIRQAIDARPSDNRHSLHTS